MSYLLTSEELDELAKLLAGHAEWTTTAGRQNFLDALLRDPQRVTGPLPLPNLEGKRTEVATATLLFLDQSDAFNPKQSLLAVFLAGMAQTLVDHYKKKRLKATANLLKLHAQLREAPRPAVEAAYRFSVPDAAIDEPPKELIDCLRDLAGRTPTVEGATVPLLLFVDHLSQAPGNAGPEPRNLALAVAGVPSASQIAASDRQMHLHRTNAETPAVGVVVQPLASGYDLRVYQWSRGKGTWDLIHQTSVADEAALKKELFKPIPEALNVIAVGDVPTLIEFFLPFRLLGWDVDQWEMDDGFGTADQIGPRYPVVVRSLERCLQRRLREEIRPRHALAPCDVLWLEPPYASCNPADQIRAQATTGLVALTHSQTPFACDLWKEVLKAGIPYALWVRGTPSSAPESVRGELERILGGTPLNEPGKLAKLVLDERSQAGSPLRSRLSVLFENPDRCPPLEEPRRASNSH